MGKLSKHAQAERDEAIQEMRQLCPPGSTVYTILDHVSSSGMSRAIRVVVPYIRERCARCNQQPPVGKHCPRPEGDTASVWALIEHEIVRETDHLHPNWMVGKILGLRHWKRNGREQDALLVGGCGMDMGFHLVNSLSQVIWGGQSCGCWTRREGATEVPYGYNDPNCPDCGGTGTRKDSGYACLGKGKCPSNYHVNYRSRERCRGPEPGAGLHGFCYAPSRWHGREIPDGWPMRDHVVTVDGDDGQPITHTVQIPLACVTQNEAGEEIAPVVCPRCEGAGDLANPDGPERFDLVHTDGYALRHRWL